MRTADQIKRKLHELYALRNGLQSRPADSADDRTDQETAARLERIEEQILLLEWVLNEPYGKYHS